VETAVVEGLKLISIENRREAGGFLEGKIMIEPAQVDLTKIFGQAHDEEIDMAEDKGQESVKRALEIVAAGRHHVLLVGVAWEREIHAGPPDGTTTLHRFYRRKICRIRCIHSRWPSLQLHALAVVFADFFNFLVANREVDY
jgi:hypothetical protein